MLDHDQNLLARSSLWRNVYESKQHLSYNETYKIDEVTNQYARQLLEYTEHREPNTRNGRRKTCVSHKCYKLYRLTYYFFRLSCC